MKKNKTKVSKMGLACGTPFSHNFLYPILELGAIRYVMQPFIHPHSPGTLALLFTLSVTLFFTTF